MSEAAFALPEAGSNDTIELPSRLSREQLRLAELKAENHRLQAELTRRGVDERTFARLEAAESRLAALTAELATAEADRNKAIRGREELARELARRGWQAKAAEAALTALRVRVATLEAELAASSA